jgi:histone acetyltransferase (RNA polymerase elongator complex component)
MSKRHYIIPIFVPHEGCPHNCVFCNQNAITGRDEQINAQYVFNTVESYLITIPKKDRIVEISFFGGTFTAIDLNKQVELLKVAKHYKDAGLVDFIHLSTRPDYISMDILDNLKLYSVDVIELGIQSMDTEVLRLSGRGHSAEDVINASNLIKSYGFVLGHQIMLGLPGDSLEKDIATTLKVIDLKPEICRIYPSLVIRNTPMEYMYQHGTYTPYSIDDAVEISKIVYGMLVSNGINVIRIGLQPTEEINIGKEIVAGPFHPAFRELVESSLITDAVLNIIPKDFVGNMVLIVNPKDLSKLYADKKKFFKSMLQQLKTVNLKVLTDISLERNKFVLKSDTFEKYLSIVEYLYKKYAEGYLNKM